MSAKSGLRTLRPGEILFNDGENSSSLYIIQKGQLRLFKPKGRGFVEIATLRAGEVIGEMAYFDEAGGGKRSCSAEAMTTTEVIEISFAAFSKTMESLNPWFKTIINTLATRLRATNTKVKELETNSVSIDYSSGKVSDYEFLKRADILKILSTLYLVANTHGESLKSGGFKVSKNVIRLYFQDVFNLNEAKYEALFLLLEKMEFIKDALSEELVVTELIRIKEFFTFYQMEKHLTEDKKLKISYSSEEVLKKIYLKVFDLDVSQDIVEINVDDIEDAHDAEDAREQGFIFDVELNKENQKVMKVNKKKLKKYLPIISFINEVKRFNEKKK